MAAVPQIRYARGMGPRSAGGQFSAVLDQKSVDRIVAKLRKASGQPLQKRMEKENYAVADEVAKRAKGMAPVGPTGNLKRSIKVRKERKYAGFARAFGVVTDYSTAVLVGPLRNVAPHRHLIIQGHRIVTPGGRDTGRRTTPNPFMDRASAGIQTQAAKRMQQFWREALR